MVGRIYINAQLTLSESGAFLDGRINVVGTGMCNGPS